MCVDLNLFPRICSKFLTKPPDLDSFLSVQKLAEWIFAEEDLPIILHQMYCRFWLPHARDLTPKEAHRWVLLLPESVRQKYAGEVLLPRLKAQGLSPVDWLGVFSQEQAGQLFKESIAQM